MKSIIELDLNREGAILDSILHMCAEFSSHCLSLLEIDESI